MAITEFKATPLDTIPSIASTARSTFRTHKTKTLAWRKTQLRRLYWAIEDFKPRLLAALRADLHRSDYESLLTEIEWLKKDCLFMLEHIDEYAKDEKLKSPDVPVAFAAMKFRIRKEPLGTVLIIGPYNFPVQLLISPLIGAIAAGCTAVLKPSELTPSVAMVIKELVEARLEKGAFAVVNGGVAETSALMEIKWDKIFFTGSSAVGTIIAKKAAETLTPVTLELGGRNPAFVTKNADLQLAARRLLWGKTVNCGQVCLSQNYVLIEKGLVDKFVEALKQAYKEMFPEGAKKSPDLARIVNKRHFARIKKMLDETKGRIVIGGEVDESELYIEPTAVVVSSVDDAMMQEESFGPIFAIYPVNTLDEALNVANLVHRTPLALYAFGSKKENERILNEMTSGGATLNDAFFHGSVNTIPFGGVGDSGLGCYHGRWSFDCFSHKRTVAETPRWVEPLLRVRYMPFDVKHMKRLAMLTEKKPDFDRDGKLIKGWAYWIKLLITLGGGSVKGALIRWLVVVLANWVWKGGRQGK